MENKDIKKKVEENIDWNKKSKEQQYILEKRHNWLIIHLESQNGFCVYCGKRIKIKNSHNSARKLDYASLDHIVPLSKGGADNMENTLASCIQCNSEKKDMDVGEFLKSEFLTKRKAIFRYHPNLPERRLIKKR